MSWVKDYNERWVNINNWDFLDHQTISDMERKVAAIKIYLEKDGDEYILGYHEAKRSDGDDLIEQIIKGVRVYLHDLQHVLECYLIEEHNEKYKSNKKEREKFDISNADIEKLIGTRFLED